MALFVARPSRGSWLFFGLVALGLVGVRGWRGYEGAVLQRDAPISEMTQDLAVCVLGGDAAWLLPTDHPEAWSEMINQWFRGVVSVQQHPTWPARCVPMAEALQAKLVATNHVPEAATRAASLVAHALRGTADNPIARTALADEGAFARDLAELLDKVRSISDGTRAGWRPIPANFQRFGTLRSPRLPRLRALGPEYSRITLLNGTSVLAWSQRDGQAHRLDLAPGALRDTALGVAVPFADVRSLVVRAESDVGPAWIVADAAPATLRESPQHIVSSDPTQRVWDAAVTPTHIALVTVDHGTARLSIARRGDARGFAYSTVVGAEETLHTMVVAPSVEGFLLTTLRPTVSDTAVDQWSVRVSDDASSTTVEGPRARTLAGNVRWGAEFPSFGARVSTCAAGAVRYFISAADRSFAVARVEGEQLIVHLVNTGWPRTTTLQVTCDRTRVLVSAVPMLLRAGHRLVTFDLRGEQALDMVIEPPMVGPSAAVRALSLVRDGVLALVANTGALRAFRYLRAPGARTWNWQVGGVVALGVLPRATQRDFTRVTMRASDDDVVCYLEGSIKQRIQDPPVQGQPPPSPRIVTTPYTALVASNNGGVDFWSP